MNNIINKISPSFDDIEYKLVINDIINYEKNKYYGQIFIYKKNEEIWTHILYLGRDSTPNRLTYNQIITGIKKAVELNIKSIIVECNNKKVINELQKKVKINAFNIYLLIKEVNELKKNFDNIIFINYITTSTSDVDINYKKYRCLIL
jgi:hypothetical protein